MEFRPHIPLYVFADPLPGAGSDLFKVSACAVGVLSMGFRYRSRVTRVLTVAVALAVVGGVTAAANQTQHNKVRETGLTGTAKLYRKAGDDIHFTFDVHGLVGKAHGTFSFSHYGGKIGTGGGYATGRTPYAPPPGSGRTPRPAARRPSRRAVGAGLRAGVGCHRDTHQKGHGMILKPDPLGLRAATCSRVASGDVPGDRVDAGTGVPLQGADGGVAGAGQQHRGRGAVLGVVRQGTVT